MIVQSALSSTSCPRQFTYAQRFDPVKLEVTGEVQPLLERVPAGRGINGGARDLALSATGTLAYLPDVARAPDALVWVSRSGAEEVVGFPLAAGSHPIGPRLSSTGDASVEAVISDVMRLEGRIDLLVNNAGFSTAPAGGG